MKSIKTMPRIAVVISLVWAFCCTNIAWAQYPTGQQVAEQAMAKALADKERNDRIVAEQRKAEKAAKDKAAKDKAAKDKAGKEKSGPASGDKTKASGGKKEK